jgi:hypothetical protein
MDAPTRSLIAALHQAPFRCALAVTGGGAAAVGWLLSVPGGSRTVLEAVVPYAESALCDYLGRRPESFCSSATACLLAARAHGRARRLAPGEPAVGLGCTASLASDRPKRGEHRFHLAVHDGVRTATHSLTLAKGARDRAGEEDVLDRVLLNALAEAAGVVERVAVPLLPGEEIVSETVEDGGPLAAFLAGRVAALCVEPDGRMRADAPRPAVLLPGSFNPLHEGHLRLARASAEAAGAAAAFELSAVNADKPALGGEEVRRRLAQFASRAAAWLTRAPTYADKAELFPGCTFVVGTDTAARIVQPRFYGGSEEAMASALGRVRARGCRFLTAGRVGPDGRFLGLDDLAVPAAYRDLFAALPEAAFRRDVSSTRLRAAGG